MLVQYEVPSRAEEALLAPRAVYHAGVKSYGFEHMR